MLLFFLLPGCCIVEVNEVGKNPVYLCPHFRLSKGEHFERGSFFSIPTVPLSIHTPYLLPTEGGAARNIHHVLCTHYVITAKINKYLRLVTSGLLVTRTRI